jgi:general secretion pathway protein I
MNPERQAGESGFTLVEVLVALAIIAFGLIAVFGQLSQSATAANRLRDKTLAHWVAVDRLTELRLSGAFPSVGTSSDDVEMANRRWHYEIKVSATDGAKLRRADVTVSFADKADRPLITVTGFLAERPPALKSSDAGWPVITPGAAPPVEDSQDADAKTKPEDSTKPDSGTNTGAVDPTGDGKQQ